MILSARGSWSSGIPPGLLLRTVSSLYAATRVSPAESAFEKASFGAGAASRDANESNAGQPFERRISGQELKPSPLSQMVAHRVDVRSPCPSAGPPHPHIHGAENLREGKVDQDGFKRCDNLSSLLPRASVPEERIIHFHQVEPARSASPRFEIRTDLRIRQVGQNRRRVVEILRDRPSLPSSRESGLGDSDGTSTFH